MSSATTDSGVRREWRSRIPRLIVGLFSVALVVMAVIVFSGMNRLQELSQQIATGMPRAEVEELLGEPVLTLRGANGSGELLCWTDIYWQVSIKLDNDGRVLWCLCVPANSWYRINQSRISSLFE